MPTPGRTPPPAPAQSSHSQGSENSAMPVRRGRRKREPFQEKGGQPAPALCHGGPELREPCRQGVALHAGTCKPWRLPHLPPQEPCRALGQQLPLAANSQVYTDAAMGKRPQPCIAVSENIQSKEGRECLQHPTSSSAQRTPATKSSYRATNNVRPVF